MQKLPEELSVELLSLVLGKEIYSIMFVEDNLITLAVKYKGYERYNIDTLTRLMKEWVANQKEVIYIDIAEGIKAKTTEIKISMNKNIYSKTLNKKLLEFNDVVEYTHWVAKEKVLI